MKIAICDDNPDYLKQYAELVAILAKKHQSEIQINTYTTGAQLLFAQEDFVMQADIIFLDIRMPGIDGVATAHQLREMKLKCEIIFFTHSTENMLDAFDVGALHYVIKGQTPVRKIEEIFLKALEKATQKKQETIVLNCAGESRSVPIQQILYFESIRHIITVHYADETFEFYSTLGKIENTLFNKGFIRTHRSYLVSIRHTVSVANYLLKLTNGEQLPVGKGNYKNLKQQLSQNR